MCDTSLVGEPLSSGQWENVPKAKKRWNSMLYSIKILDRSLSEMPWKKDHVVLPYSWSYKVSG